ncbi:MAG: hypothetical protein AB1765_01710 [Candidatus Hydrogenedentota bacterium]
MIKGCLFYVIITILIVYGGAVYIDQRYLPKHQAKEFLSDIKILQESTLYPENEKTYPKAKKYNAPIPGIILNFTLLDASFEKFYIKWVPQEKKDFPQCKLRYRIKFNKSYGQDEDIYVIILENEEPNNPFIPGWVVTEFVEEEER